MARRTPPPPIPAPDLHSMDRDAMQRETLERQRRQDGYLFGDGSEDKPGLIVRVDRIETKLKWLFGALAAIGGAMLTWLASQLPSLFPPHKP